MSTRRTLLGALPGGTFGLRTTLSGYDVFNDDSSDPSKFSFNSDWNDLVQVRQVGQVTISSAPGVATPVYYPSLGYLPFVEVRYRSGTTVYDDYNPDNELRPGWAVAILTDHLNFPSGTSAFSLLYIIYKILVPSQ